MKVAIRSGILVTISLAAMFGCGGNSGPAGGTGGHAGGAAGSAGGAGAGGQAAAGTSGGGGAAGGTTGAAGMGGRGGASGAAGTGGAAGAGGATGAGGAAGTTGAAGAGGTAGTTGAAGAGGAAGTTGAAGAGGAAGTTGAAGIGGRGGAGGAAGAAGGGAGGAAGGAGGATATSGLALEYATASATMTAFDLRVTNAGPSTPLVSVIKLRYYFTDDSAQGVINVVFDLARWTIAGSATPINLLTSGGCTAVGNIRPIPTTSYTDFNCGLTSPLGVGDVLNFTIRFNTSAQNPANDYSYLDTGGTLMPNPHMLVLVNGVVVAGTPAP